MGRSASQTVENKEESGVKDRELTRLGRIHTYEDFKQTFRLARKSGFDNLNVDIMSALPVQTLSSYIKTLEKVTGFEPEHISAYSLIIEPGTAFEKAVGQLVCQQVTLPGVAAGQAVAQGGFAFAVQVAVGGVEVAEACCQKIVHHAAGLFKVHLTGRVGGGAGKGQAHAAEPQLFGSKQFFHGKETSVALNSVFIIKRGRGLVNGKNTKKPLTPCNPHLIQPIRIMKSS